MALASILFLLLCGLSSWRVWRRSPAYSLRLTLEVFGVCAAILVLSLSIAYLPLSEGTHAALSIGCMLLCVLGGPALIVRLTNQKVAALPAGTQLLSIHRLKIQHWIWRLLIFIAVCAGSTLVLKGDLIWLPITLGGFVALCASLALILLYMRATRLDRGLSVVLDKPWIHWQYTEEEWKVWAASQFKQNADNNRRYQRMIATVPDTYIGEEGIYSGGEFTLWSLSGSYLIEGVTECGPPAYIRFLFQTNIKETKMVLIPNGQEADLELLQQKLRHKIPNAQLRVSMPVQTERAG